MLSILWLSVAIHLLKDLQAILWCYSQRRVTEETEAEELYKQVLYKLQK